MIIIEKEAAADAAAIEAILEAGFGPNRHAKTVYKLRQTEPVAELCLVARKGYEATVGASIRYWAVEVEGLPAPLAKCLLLGPLAVDPVLQGQGLGRTLVARSLQEADLAGWPICLVVGEPSYYEPFGFRPATPFGFALPGPVEERRFQVRASDETLALLSGLAGAKPVGPWGAHRDGAANGVSEDATRAA